MKGSAVRFSKLPKSFRARKVFFLSLFYRLSVCFSYKLTQGDSQSWKPKMFLRSKSSKVEFLVMNFVHVKSFREFQKRTPVP